MEFKTDISDFGLMAFPAEADEAAGVSGFFPAPIAAVTPSNAVRSLKPFEPKHFPTDSLPDSILTNWSRIAQANMTVGMYADLIRVAFRPAGWRGPGSLSLQTDSVKNSLDFWSLVRANAAEPELVLAPDGSLHAEWFKSQRQRLDVRFSNKKVFFGLLNKNSILEGADDKDTVGNILRSHHANPLMWSAK
jgi:hypothetical protein